MYLYQYLRYIGKVSYTALLSRMRKFLCTVIATSYLCYKKSSVLIHLQLHVHASDTDCDNNESYSIVNSFHRTILYNCSSLTRVSIIHCVSTSLQSDSHMPYVASMSVVE